MCNIYDRKVCCLLSVWDCYDSKNRIMERNWLGKLKVYRLKRCSSLCVTVCVCVWEQPPTIITQNFLFIYIHILFWHYVIIIKLFIHTQTYWIFLFSPSMYYSFSLLLIYSTRFKLTRGIFYLYFYYVPTILCMYSDNWLLFTKWIYTTSG